MQTLGLILLSAGMSGGGQLLLRWGARGEGGSWLASLLNPATVAGLLLWALSTVVWLLVLRRTDLSYAYCLGSLNYIFVPLLASRLFNERLSMERIVGMMLIFLGVLVTIHANYRTPAG